MVKNLVDGPPIGILVTWGKDMIKEKGGLLAFLRYFEQGMYSEDFGWLHKCNHKPAHDILYVYIVVCNQIRYKLYYGGYQTGPTTIYNGDGRSWSSSQIINWPRLVLAGPVVKAPYKIPQKGFQGFRYIFTEPF